MKSKILKKDLRRKKSMNFILLLFVMLATTFIAASISNVKVIVTGVDHYFEMANLPDYIINTMSGINGEKTDNEERIEAFLEECVYVDSYTIENGLMVFQSQVEDVGDAKMDLFNTLAVFPLTGEQIYFDENNEPLTEIGEGEVYIPKKMLGEHFEIGDSFYIKSGDYKKKFTVKGVEKDALLGADLMGMTRILVSDEDYREMIEQGIFNSQNFYHIATDDVDAFYQEYVDRGFYILFGGTMETIRTTYIMDLIVAGIILVVSICLIVIAAIMLRFTILFTVNEDYKEIGIMKAIGMPNPAIRSLYVVKYLVISIVGAVLGLVCSIPFANLLLENVTKNIVVENSKSNLFISVITSVLVVIIIVGFAYLSTGRIKKFTPMDAIRSGNNGERFSKKNVISLHKAKMRPSSFLAINDVLCELKKYIVIVFTGMIGVWLVVMPANTINTLRSEKVIPWFGMAPCDFYITEQGRIEENVASADRKRYEKYLLELEENLKEWGVPVSGTSTEVVLKYKISKGELSYNSVALLGLNRDTEDYVYEKGLAPKEANEIAVTHIVAKKIDAHIGDTVYITMYGEERPFVITAIYQSMTNMGEGIRFTERADLDFKALGGGFGVQVVLEEGSDKEEAAEWMDLVQEKMPDADIQEPVEMLDAMIGSISEQLVPIKSMILLIVIIINVLVVVLMQKMFLIREKSEMGMLKSMGFSNRSIISWQTKRIALVLSVGILLGTATGRTFSQITSGEIFKMMGASKIEFVIEPLEVYVIYPLAIFAVTILACMVTMLQVRKIGLDSVRDAE